MKRAPTAAEFEAAQASRAGRVFPKLADDNEEDGGPAATTAAASPWYAESEPEVSIVVLSFNRSALTLKCLRHLWRWTTGRTYEIIVVDNGSSAAEAAMLADIRGPFRLIRLDQNRYFGEGNNIGVEAARGTRVVLLNTDAFVTAGWLEPLVELMDREAAVGVVCPLLLYPDGRLQEAGAFMSGFHGHSVQVGKYPLMDDSEIREPRPVDYGSAACLLVRRDLFLRLGGFDVLLEPAYFEDADLCLRLRALGYSTYCEPRSVVYHQENATTATAFARDWRRRTAALNRVKFVDRWGEWLRARHVAWDAALPAGLVPPPSRVADRTRPLAVFFTSARLCGNEATGYFLAAAAACRAHHRVVVATPQAYSRCRLSSLGLMFGLDLSDVTSVSAADLADLGVADLMVACGPGAAEAAALARRYWHLCLFDDGGAIVEAARQRIIDGVVVPSHLAARTLARQGLKAAAVVVISPPVAAISGTVSHGTGIAAHAEVRGGAIAGHGLLARALRRVRRRVPEATLRVAASFDLLVDNPCDLDLLDQPPGAVFHPYSTPALWERLVADAAVYWEPPLDIGAGAAPGPDLGTAGLRAMARGLVPCAVSGSAFAEAISPGVSGFIYRTIRELAEITTALLADRARWEAMSAAAREATTPPHAERFATQWERLAAGAEIGSADLLSTL